MSQQIVVAKDEERFIPLLWLGEEAELSYDIILAEPGASVRFLGLLLGKNKDALTLNVTVTHAAPHTTSNVIIKSALTDNARIDIVGLVKIQPGAKGTKAWLAAHLLLLSDKAKGQAIPSLEILENDIKAGHATTVGRVSDLELFYLMSRGLPHQTAKQLIVSGFMQDAINAFPAELATRALQELAI